MKQFLLSIILVFSIVGCKSSIEERDNVSDDISENNRSLQLHNSRNSLDWEGTYSGILPCEDCMGVETIIEIKDDQTYRVIQRRTGADEQTEEKESKGYFTWNDEGSVIELENQNEIPWLKVGENFLVPLDPRGFEVKAEPGNNFKLLKL